MRSSWILTVISAHKCRNVMYLLTGSVRGARILSLWSSYETDDCVPVSPHSLCLVFALDVSNVALYFECVIFY